jgi:hypothetical protein
VKTGSIISGTGLWSKTFSMPLQENSVKASKKNVRKNCRIFTAWGREIQDLDFFSKFSKKA